MAHNELPLFYIFHFYLFGLIAIASALLFVTRKSPVAAALWLVNTMFCLAALYVLLDAQFIGAIQVLVYAGAIMVVFLFVIMLLNLGHASEVGRRARAGLEARRPALVGARRCSREMFALTQARRRPMQLDAAARASSAEQVAQTGAIAPIAGPLFHEYLLAFEVTSVLLLVAIVGAVVLGKQRGERAMLAEALFFSRRAVHDRRGRRADAPQRDHRLHVRRADAQRREPDVRRVRAGRTASAGQVFVFFVMTVAAAEAAVGLAIIIALFRHRQTVDLQNINLLKG